MRKPLSDEEIVDLYFERKEEALDCTKQRHGRMIYAICKSILHSREDAEECESSVYYAAWTSIPPLRPRNLAAYLSRIARNKALDRLRKEKREKRGAGKEEYPYSELDGLFSQESTEDQIEAKELAILLNSFLENQTKEKQLIFTLRYYHEKSLSDVGKVLGISKPSVYYKLQEMKEELKKKLEKEGYAL